MGRRNNGKGGLAHCEGICKMHRSSEVGAARSAADMCSALPCFGRGVGQIQFPLGHVSVADDGTLAWMQAADSIRR
jgi:hypothetical protein